MGIAMRWFHVACVLQVAVMAGCRTAPAEQGQQQRFVLADSPGRTMVRTELFFGLGAGSAAAVSNEQWERFVRDEVTPRFPDGLTIIDARGQWRDETAAAVEVQREPSRVLVIVHAGTRADHQRIEQIRSLYRQRFAQQSVMRADSIEKVSF
jgi:hypothetical protein